MHSIARINGPLMSDFSTNIYCHYLSTFSCYTNVYPNQDNGFLNHSTALMSWHLIFIKLMVNSAGLHRLLNAICIADSFLDL